MNLDEIHFLRALGSRMRERRTELGLTQQELADRCGLHRTFIGSVKRGERNLAILNVWLIAKFLWIPLADLFRGASGKTAQTE